MQRNDLSRTEPTIPPPPGVSVPSYTSTHGHTTGSGTFTTVTTTGKPVPHTSEYCRFLLRVYTCSTIYSLLALQLLIMKEQRQIRYNIKLQMVSQGN